MNQTAVLVVIGVAVAVLVAWPFLKRGRPPAGPAVIGSSSRDDVPDELAELEMDRAMGRVSDADYERLKARLAATTVGVPPRAGGADPAPAVVAPAPAAASSRAEDLVRRWREAPRPSCASCGVRPEPAARFCSNCGAPVA